MAHYMWCKNANDPIDKQNEILGSLRIYSSTIAKKYKIHLTQ